jgi:natural product precursor
MKTLKSLKLNQLNAFELGKREARFITGGYSSACGSSGCICACGIYSNRESDSDAAKMNADLSELA